MQYTIAYDNHNRLRLRCGDYVLTREKANGLTEQLLELQGVRTAQVNFRTGSILVTYTPAPAGDSCLGWGLAAFSDPGGGAYCGRTGGR